MIAVILKLWVLFSLAIFAWALWPRCLSWPRRTRAPRLRIIDHIVAEAGDRS